MYAPLSRYLPRYLQLIGVTTFVVDVVNVDFDTVTKCTMYFIPMVDILHPVMHTIHNWGRLNEY